jgi:hypothetical protein
VNTTLRFWLETAVAEQSNAIPPPVIPKSFPWVRKGATEGSTISVRV